MKIERQKVGVKCERRNGVYGYRYAFMVQESFSTKFKNTLCFGWVSLDEFITKFKTDDFLIQYRG